MSLPISRTIVLHLLTCVVNEKHIDEDLFRGISSDDWYKTYEFALKQGVTAVCIGAMQNLSKGIIPSSPITKRWISHSIAIEQQMRKKNAIAVEFAAKMYEKRIPIVVLKGITYAHYYPFPNQRECGDLDCYMMGKKEEGDKALVVMGGHMENAGYKHSHLYYKKLTIENHQYLTSFDNSKRGIATEKLLQKLIRKKLHYLGETKLLSPSPEFTVLFLIKHSLRHFIKEGINLRILMDWALFLKAESYTLNWEEVFENMKQCGIYEFANVLTYLCITYLGLENIPEILKESAFTSNFKISRNVFEDILTGHKRVYCEPFVQNIIRIYRRIVRMWKYRSLADECYLRLIWNSLFYNSIFNLKVHYK